MLYRRDYAAAIAMLKTAIAHAGPDTGNIVGYYYSKLGLAEQRSGDAASAHASYLAGRKAMERLEKAGDHSYFLYAYLALNEAGLGEADAARRDGQKSIEVISWAPSFVGGLQENLARVEAQLGDTDAALKLISVLLRKPYLNNVGIAGAPLTVALLRLDPAWDPLRHDPRFQTLLKRYANPAPALATVASSATSKHLRTR